jgi:beta-lactamase class A
MDKIVVTAAFLHPVRGRPQTTGRLRGVDTARDEQLQTQLRDIIADEIADNPQLNASFQLATDDGVIAHLAPTLPHYAASTMKLPLLLAAYRLRDAGTLNLDSTVTVGNSFTSQAGGTYQIDRDDDSDEAVWEQLGRQVTLRWLCRRSIIRSSNLATNHVLEAVGLDAVDQAIAACGADGLQVVRGIGDFAAREDGRRNLVTVAGLNTMLAAIANGIAAEPQTCQEILAILAANEMATDVRGGLLAGTWVAHKNGWVSDAVLDAALVRPAGESDRTGEFMLSVAISGVGEEDSWEEAKSHAVIRRVAAAVWQQLAGAGAGLT